jgi:predicted aspartyl protease
VLARISDFLFVEVSVNGVSGTFILDTGADAFVVSGEFAERAGLPVVSNAQVVTIAGSSFVDVVRIAEFRFANTIGVDIDAAVLDLQGIDGIVGLPFFNAVVISIDYAAQELVISDPATYSLAEAVDAIGGTIYPANNLVLENVVIDGVSIGPLRVDTGSSGGIRLSQERGGSFVAAADNTLAVVSSASNGQVPGTAIIVDEVSIDPFLLDNQFMVVQQAPLDVGLMGGLVLRQFFVIFDAGRGQMLLRQDRAIEYALLDIPRILAQRSLDDQRGLRFAPTP